MNDPESTGDMMAAHTVQRSRALARELLDATAPYDPPPSTEPPAEGVLRGGLYYLALLTRVVPEAGRAIGVALRTTEPEGAELMPTHPADVLELAHPPAYQQVLALAMRHDLPDPDVVATLASDLARAWEHTLMAARHHLAKGGVEEYLKDLDHDLQEQADEADALLQRTRSLQYLSAGQAARFADAYVDVDRELVAGVLTEGREVHGRVVTGLPEGSELMGAGWIPEAAGTLRLWFKRPGEHVVGSQPEAILATTEQTHRPTFSLSRKSGPAHDQLVREWLKRTRAELAEDKDRPPAVRRCAEELLGDLEGTLNGWPNA